MVNAWPFLDRTPTCSALCGRLEPFPTLSEEIINLSANFVYGLSKTWFKSISGKGFLQKCDLSQNERNIQCEAIDPVKSTPDSGIGLSMAFNGTDAKVLLYRNIHIIYIPSILMWLKTKACVFLMLLRVNLSIAIFQFEWRFARHLLNWCVEKENQFPGDVIRPTILAKHGHIKQYELTKLQNL